MVKIIQQITHYFPFFNSLDHFVSKKRFQFYMKKKLGNRYRVIDSGPVGDRDIILKTAVLKETEISNQLDTNRYFASGYRGMLYWLKQLEEVSFDINKVQSIMELGCGSARMIRHLRCIKNLKLIGTDVNTSFVKWCQTNISGIDFHSNELSPPLSFLTDNSLDLVFAESVFTHIPLTLQASWIKELYRVLQPGGYLMISVLGEYHQNLMLSSEEQEELRKKGTFTLAAQDKKASYSTKLIGSWDVFQTKENLHQAFSQHFTIIEDIPLYLDLLILKKEKLN